MDIKYKVGQRYSHVVRYPHNSGTITHLIGDIVRFSYDDGYNVETDIRTFNIYFRPLKGQTYTKVSKPSWF